MGAVVLEGARRRFVLRVRCPKCSSPSAWRSRRAGLFVAVVVLPARIARSVGDGILPKKQWGGCMEVALNEISLVLFASAAPAGGMGCLIALATLALTGFFAARFSFCAMRLTDRMG